VREKVDAGNMLGASTDGLVIIRRHFFPHGELPDGGGAVPPTAAGVLCGNGTLLLVCGRHKTVQGVTMHFWCDWLLGLQSTCLVVQIGPCRGIPVLQYWCTL